MGKREYTDEQYADVLTRYARRHRRVHLLVLGVGLAGVVAAGTASYVLMHRAETMSEDGIDEMTANDYIILDEEQELDAALNGAGAAVDEADPDAPLIEEVFGDADDQAPDAFPADAFAEAEESETESEAEQSETTVGEVAESDTAQETEERVPAGTEVLQPEETELSATEEAASESEESEDPESEASESEKSEEIEAFDSTETEAETEPETESETESELIGTAQAVTAEKTAEDVYVETEGEDADPDWVQSVSLEVQDAEGLWTDTETEDDTVVEVGADQQLRFTLTCTVEPGKLNVDSRTLIYHVPEEITSLTQSWGTIVDAEEKPLADYAVEENGTIRITFTEEAARLNELGARITCLLEFRTTAGALK